MRQQNKKRFRIFAMTHKKPTEAADEWLADRRQLAELREEHEAALYNIKSVEQGKHEVAIMLVEKNKELAELREALTKIAEIGDGGYPVTACANIARAALLEGK